MPKRALPLKSPSITLDRTSKTPLSRQIYLGLRNAILEGVYLSHERVPSTRMLAATVGVSRNTVQTAYDQLSAKGYVCGKVGSGTRVAKPIPDTYLRELLRPSPVAPYNPLLYVTYLRLQNRIQFDAILLYTLHI